MNVPAPSRRRYGVLLIWCGGVAMALTGAFTFAWVKLPEWQPQWVIDHSPWADPGVRALLAPRTRSRFDSVPDPVLRWGESIGPVLLAHYQGAADPKERREILHLASRTAERLTEDNPRAAPYPRLSESAAWRLREDLLRLVAMAMAGSDGLRTYEYNAIYIAVCLRGRDLVPEVRRYVRGFKEQLRDDEALVVYLRDAGDLDGLLELQSWYEGKPYRSTVMAAIVECLRPVEPAVAPSPVYDPDSTLRPWATYGRRQALPDAAVRQRIINLLDDPDDTIRRLAIGACVTARFTEVAVRQRIIELLDDPNDTIRRLAIEACVTARFTEAMPKLAQLLDQGRSTSFRPHVIKAIGALAMPESGPLLRPLVKLRSEPWLCEAMSALGSLRDPADFHLLLPLVADEDERISRTARFALFRLPLTSEQKNQVEAAWAQRQKP